MQAKIRTIIQLEQALNGYQEALFDESGTPMVDQEWFNQVDELLKKFIEYRSLQNDSATINWKKLMDVIYE